MTSPSIVAVYGYQHKRRKPVRLGAGSLQLERLVLPDDRLRAQLSGPQPPRVQRVGIASQVDDNPFVEVIEVRQVVSNEDGTMFGIELAAAAESPTTIEALTDPDSPFPTGPANGWCFLFPTLSFC